MEAFTRKPNIECVICRRPVYRRPFEIKQAQGRAFCGKTCYGISCRKAKPCIICGTLILSSFHRKTCSRSCSNKHRTGIRYKMNRPKDKVEYYRGLKIRLFEQRGEKCERCGFDGFEILQIHHKDRDRENNVLENLELICPNCHATEHYSKNSWLKKGRNREEWLEGFKAPLLKSGIRATGS